MASTDTPYTCWALSTGVRQRPSKTGWVVTQFVTQLFTSHLTSPHLSVAVRKSPLVAKLRSPLVAS